MGSCGCKRSDLKASIFLPEPVPPKPSRSDSHLQKHSNKQNVPSVSSSKNGYSFLSENLLRKNNAKHKKERSKNSEIKKTIIVNGEGIIISPVKNSWV